MGTLGSLAELGGAGQGLVWGWLLVGSVVAARHWRWAALSLAAGTLSLAFGVILVGNLVALVGFSSGVVLGGTLHLIWRAYVHRLVTKGVDDA